MIQDFRNRIGDDARNIYQRPKKQIEMNDYTRKNQ